MRAATSISSTLLLLQFYFISSYLLLLLLFFPFFFLPNPHYAVLYLPISRQLPYIHQINILHLGSMSSVLDLEFLLAKKILGFFFSYRFWVSSEILLSNKSPNLISLFHMVYGCLLKFCFSYVETGDSGIALVASGATANLSIEEEEEELAWEESFERLRWFREAEMEGKGLGGGGAGLVGDGFAEMEEKLGRVGLSVSEYLKPETEPKIHIRVGLCIEPRFSILKPNRIGLFY
ncbi:hypothetical protein RchiOBHm_Chr3g0452751 [Rosa chinensis]|uniref:Uncharacterized protein n=1 Tax=Rosa chinensis TaxID=74649 RepID=A0A2P6R6D6_ROSCH|nr:hypothetical protein RchiOBHm_Chr3g0452751 [Rosa chinensis]